MAELADPPGGNAVLRASQPADEGFGPPVSPQPFVVVRRQRRSLPVILFLITCVSTFWAGACGWLPMYYVEAALRTDDATAIRVALLRNWSDGLIYMVCVLAILLTHEMGHFLTSRIYRIPASYPYFLPFPISPIGTMGAVIGMAGRRADRRQMFDIGLAGPIAGLIVAVPVMAIGIAKLDLTTPQHGPFTIDLPLAVRWVLNVVRPSGFQPGGEVWYSQLNPYFMAGWVGLLITGLNMLPVSQLDGGHVIYTLFGRAAHWIARGFMLAAISYILYYQAWTWSIMVFLVLLMGTDHPPTRDDRVPLGWFRTALGVVSLAIPVLCFPPNVFKIVS